MRTKILLLVLLLVAYPFVNLSAQTMPLVYSVENTGANFPVPYMPTLNQLPVIQSLPDPFEWANGAGRMSNYSDWEGRRNEIGGQIQSYEIGVKPPRPDTITATYSGGQLTVNVTVNGRTLLLTSSVVLPSGTGPFPVMIGMNTPFNYIFPSGFLSNNIIQIVFNANQVTTYNGTGSGTLPSNSDPYYQLYPNLNLDITGQYSAWAWGVSRLIDGLELVQAQGALPVDLKHIAVVGCSYAGKMALFAGAFDERVALTIALESGGGGATSWRYSHVLNTQNSNSVEGIDNTDYDWFENSMNQFSGDNVSKMPEDHHELMAMCAPRALYATANPSYIWLADPSCYVASNGCKQVYAALGISDRFGYSIVGNHNHCQIPDNQLPEIAAFVNKFLLGEDTVNTSGISDFPDTTGDNYGSIDLTPWITWTNPTLANDTTYFTTLAYPPNGQRGLDTSITLKWNKQSMASQYLIQLSASPTSAANLVVNDSTTDTVQTVSGLTKGQAYYWWVRLKSSGSLGPRSSVWQFITTVPLPATPPTIVSATPLNPSQPDTMILTWNKVQYASQYIVQLSHGDLSYPFYNDSTSDTSMTTPRLTLGLEYYWRVRAENYTGYGPWSDSNFTVTGIKKEIGTPTEFSLSQNYPNPFNPTTIIEFALPKSAFTRLTIYDLLGREVRTLISRTMEAGYYEADFDASALPSGVYFYRIQAGSFSETRKLLLVK